MAKRLWKAEQRDDAQALITFLLAKRKPNGGWPVDGETSLAIDELAASLDEAVTHKRALSVVEAMHKLGTSTVADYEAAHATVTKGFEHHASTRRQLWTILLPMKATLDGSVGDRASLSVAGKRVQLLSIAAAQRAVGRRLKLDAGSVALRTHVEVGIVPDMFVRLDSVGVDLHDAWKSAQATFNLFRGVFEFTTGYGSESMQWGRRTSRATIAHPAWMLGFPKTGDVEGTSFLLDHVRTDRHRPFTFDARGMTILRNQFKVLARSASPDTVGSVIVDALRLYADAMDTQFPHQCLLGLWQTAEAITLSKEVGGRTDEVCRRLDWHGERLGLVGSGVRFIVKRVAEKRNLIVHHGVHDVHDGDVNRFKMVVDVSLAWLIHARKRLVTRERLQRFYEVLTRARLDPSVVPEVVRALRRRTRRRQTR